MLDLQPHSNSWNPHMQSYACYRQKLTKVDKFLQTESRRMIVRKTIDLISQRRGTASQTPNSLAPQNARHLTNVSSTYWTHRVCHRLQLHQEHLGTCIKTLENHAKFVKLATISAAQDVGHGSRRSSQLVGFLQDNEPALWNLHDRPPSTINLTRKATIKFSQARRTSSPARSISFYLENGANTTRNLQMRASWWCLLFSAARGQATRREGLHTVTWPSFCSTKTSSLKRYGSPRKQ